MSDKRINNNDTMENSKTFYRVIWGIGCYEDFASILDAKLLKNQLLSSVDFKDYPKPHISKFINGENQFDWKEDQIDKELGIILDEILSKKEG